MDEFKPQGGSGRTAERRHESKDLKVSAVGAFAFGLVLFGAAMFLALGWMFGRFARDEQRRDRPPSPVAERPPTPPSPRLEVDPRRVLVELREREETLLNTYGWADRTERKIRIPIRRAMDLLLERGLPARGVPSEEGGSEQ
jgi:hypothetical protein